MANKSNLGGKLIKDKPYVDDENVSSRSKIKIVDLFAGIGGFHYGVAAAAARINKGVKPLLVSEIEPSCQETYKNNHGCEVHGDVNTVPLKGITDVADILTAGFPCQPFSNSGLKLGLSDPRGQFYGQIEKIIKTYSAKSFILENVPGIRTNGGGSYPSILMPGRSVGLTMHTLESHLVKLKDYSVKWLEIDSSTLGSPQVRKRVYIVGIHKDFVNELELEFGQYQQNSFMSIVDKKKIEIPSLELSTNQERNLRSFMSSAPSYKDGMRRVGKAYLCDGGNVGQGYHAYGLMPTLTKVWARFLPVYFPAEGETLPELGIPTFVPGKKYGSGYIRRASVQEAMLLQGFPKSFAPHPTERIAFEHAGNAVNAKVVREIAENLLRQIN